MGGPDSLEAVKPFLLNLLSDREIIKIGPAWLQPFIARMIVRRRAPVVAEKYREIGSKSPIRELPQAQADALSEQLGLPCYVGMRYWHPFTRETLLRLRHSGIKKLVALSLYPHYSRATSGSSYRQR
jgi:ferrochelatase